MFCPEISRLMKQDQFWPVSTREIIIKHPDLRVCRTRIVCGFLTSFLRHFCDWRQKIKNLKFLHWFPNSVLSAVLRSFSFQVGVKLLSDACYKLKYIIYTVTQNNPMIKKAERKWLVKLIYECTAGFKKQSLPKLLCHSLNLLTC